MGAITFEPDVKQGVSLDGFRQKTRKMSPAQKRHAYALKAGETLRENWSVKNRRE
jgi:hypothetical protein